MTENKAIDENLTTTESPCLKCGETGTSSFLFINVPHFKELVLCNFTCKHCGYFNKEIISARALSEFGVKYSLVISQLSDLNRQVVKSLSSTICLPELLLEIPCLSSGQKAQNLKDDNLLSTEHAALVITIEGLLANIIEDLGHLQPQRQLEAPQSYDAIEAILNKIQAVLDGTGFPLLLTIDDPSGNSYIESPPESGSEGNRSLLERSAPEAPSLDGPKSLDSTLSVQHYVRSEHQTQELGFSTAPTTESLPESSDDAPDDSIYEFNEGICPSCKGSCPTRMHPIDIPYFKSVIIMATVCDHCGYKSSEVKCGSAISSHGCRTTLAFSNAADLNRDVLKSESCSIDIPEISLHLTYGTLGGKFTTIEGLLSQIKDELTEKVPFAIGDSADPNKGSTFRSLIQNIEKICNAQLPCTIIIDDPLDNSYLQNLMAPEPDPQITIQKYQRTWEQNEAFGINDMKV